MSTQPEVWDREIQKVNDAAQEASFQVYRNHQDSINRTRARTLAEKVLNLVREEYETYETADGKWDENLRRQLGAPRADNLRRQGIRERLPAAVSKFTQELHPEEAMSPEEALLVLRATETAILAVDGSGSAGSDDDRFQASDGQQPRAGRSALLTPPGRDSKGPSGLKRTREQSVSPKPGDQTSPAQEGNVSHHFYPVTHRHDQLARG